MLNDLRRTGRALWRTPGFAAIAVLTLALGIGASSAVFNLVEGALLTPPPYPAPERIVLLSSARKDGQPYDGQGCPTGQWTLWRTTSKTFEAVAAYDWTFNYLISDEGSVSVEGLKVSPEYFKVTGISPILGRAFVKEDAASGLIENEKDSKPERFIILGYDLWQRRFKGDPGVIGQAVTLSRRAAPLTIVGVMPPDVRFLPSVGGAREPNYDLNARVDYWLAAWPNEAKPNDTGWNVVARLKLGVTIDQARAELALSDDRWAEADQDFKGMLTKMETLDEVLNREGRRVLLPLLGAVGLVFLIACGNVAGLLLARGFQRQREYAVRGALGARRVQLFGYALNESLLLALPGGVFGSGLAIAVVKVLKITAGPAIPRLDAVAVGWPVLAFCVLASAVAAVMAGLAPAIHASRLDPARGLRSGGPNSSASRVERRLLGAVAVAQTALTLALLAGAGLLIRAAGNLGRVRPGYDTQKILTMSVTAVKGDMIGFHRLALDRVSAIPGVGKAAFAWGVPLTGNKWVNTFEIIGRPGTSRLEDKLTVPTRGVTQDYFDTVGIKIVEGRCFQANDTRDWSTNAPAHSANPFAVVVNQALARRYFPNEEPLGKRLGIVGWKDHFFEIVGVAADTRDESLTRPAGPEIYFSFWQMNPFTKHLVIRAASDPGRLIRAVERELRAIDPTVAVDHVKTLGQIRDDSIAPRIFAMRLLVGFALLASVLAVVGIYGALSLSVGSRKREIAIRTAIGAQRGEILRLVFTEGARLIGVGLLLGAIMALALGRLLKAFLFEVGPGDPVTLLGVSVLFLGAGLAACWAPARRATEVDPMVALRND